MSPAALAIPREDRPLVRLAPRLALSGFAAEGWFRALSPLGPAITGEDDAPFFYQATTDRQWRAFIHFPGVRRLMTRVYQALSAASSGDSKTISYSALSDLERVLTRLRDEAEVERKSVQHMIEDLATGRGNEDR